MKYSIQARVLHWLMAVLIITLLGVGIYMVDFLPKDSPSRLTIYSLHKSVGVMVLILVLVRLTNRLLKSPPPLPASLPQWEIILAKVGHFGLYILMILVPLSGYLMSNSFGFPVKFFTIEMPRIIAANPERGKFFSEAHEILAFTLLALVVVHVLAAIKHHYFDRPENDILKRMI